MSTPSRATSEKQRVSGDHNAVAAAHRHGLNARQDHLNAAPAEQIHRDKRPPDSSKPVGRSTHTCFDMTGSPPSLQQGFDLRPDPPMNILNGPHRPVPDALHPAPAQHLGGLGAALPAGAR